LSNQFKVTPSRHSVYRALTLTLLWSAVLPCMQAVPGIEQLPFVAPEISAEKASNSTSAAMIGLLPCSAQNPQTPLLPDRPKWGVIDETGNYTIEPKFEENLRTSDGMVLATPYSPSNKYFEDLKLYLYDAHGKQIIKDPLNEPDSYHSGLMSVKNGEVYGYLDKQGKLALPYRYMSGVEFHGDYAINFLADHFEIMDRTGKTVWKPSDGKIKVNNKYDLGVLAIGAQAVLVKITKGKAPGFMGWFEQELMPFEIERPSMQLGTLHGYLDKNGNVAIEPIYTIANNFVGGLAYVQQNNRHLIIDTKGYIKLELKQNEFSGQTQSGLTIIRTKPTVKGLHPTLCKWLPDKIVAIDINRNVVTPTDCDNVSASGNAKLLIASKQTEDGPKCGFIDAKGAVKIPFKFDGVRDFVDGYALVAVANKKQPTQQIDNQSTEQSSSPNTQQANDQSTNALTLEPAKELDQSIRNKLKAALTNVTITEPLRLMVNIPVEGAINVSLLKGTASKLSKADISGRLKSVTGIKRPAPLNNIGFNLEYIALTDGTIIGAEEAGDPFAQSRTRLSEINKSLTYSYYFKSTEEHIKHLEDKAALEFSLSNGRMEGSSTFGEFLRLYCATGAFDKAEALAKRVDVVDPENGYDLLMELYSRTNNYQGQLTLLERQYRQRLGSYCKIDSYDPLIGMGYIYYLQGKMSLAGDCYKKAANTTDNHTYTTDAFAAPAKEVPLDAMYIYACYLADRGRIRESAALIRKCLSLMQAPQEGVNPRIVEGRFDNFATYLAIIKDKDPVLFKEIKQAKEQRYPSNAAYGLLDKTGKEITGQDFAKILFFAEGLAAAQDPLSHRFGYIDKSGQWAIPARFYAATPFYKGLAPVSVSKGLFPLDEYGYTKPYSIIDKTGKVTLSTDYFKLYPLFRGHLWAVGFRQDDKSNIIDYSGRVIFTGRINPGYYTPLSSDASAFTAFAAVGRVNGGCTSQEVGAPVRFLIQPTKATAAAQESVSYKLSQVFPTPYRTEDQGPGRFGYKDAKGEVVLPATYLSASVFCDDLAAVQSEITGKYSYIDATGKTAINSEYDQASDFENGVAVVSKDGQTYLIDKSGKKSSPDFPGISPLPNDYYLITDGENHAGIMSKAGKVIIAPKYQSIRQFSEGLAAFCKEDKWGFVNEQGVEVIPAIYKEVGDFTEGMTFYKKI